MNEFLHSRLATPTSPRCWHYEPLFSTSLVVLVTPSQTTFRLLMSRLQYDSQSQTLYPICNRVTQQDQAL